MTEQRQVPRLLLALLGVLVSACGGDASMGFRLASSTGAIPTLRLEPLRLEALERWDLLPRNSPLLKSEDAECLENSCWLLHNDGARAVRLLNPSSGQRHGLGAIERRGLDGQWHDFLERRVCTCGMGNEDWPSEMELPAGGTRQLGESSCDRQHPPLPTGAYRFLLPLIVEVDGAPRPGLIARRFLVHPAPSVERGRLRELLNEPRIAECDAQTALAAMLIHGMDERSMQALLATDQVPPPLHETMLDALMRLPDGAGLLAEPLARVGSPLGLRFAMRVSPQRDCGRNGTNCDAALSQLLHAFSSGPPDAEVVDALAPWYARWPDTVLDRLIELLGQELDEPLRTSVEESIESAIAESAHHRARAATLLAQRCQPPQTCADDAGRQSVARLLQEGSHEEEGALSMLFGSAQLLRRVDDDLLDSLRGGACADLTHELREYGRYIDGEPLDVELGETETEICDAAPPQEDPQFRRLPVGCARAVEDWKTYLQNQELLRTLDPALPPHP